MTSAFHAVENPAGRMVGESYKDYADRLYGMYRAQVSEVNDLLELVRTYRGMLEPCNPCGHPRDVHRDRVQECSECECEEWWK